MRNDYSENKVNAKKNRKSLGFEDEPGVLSEAVTKSKKTSFKKKKKSIGNIIQKSVEFCEEDSVMNDLDTKSLGSICLVIDPVEETLSLYSGKHNIENYDRIVIHNNSLFFPGII